MLFFSWVMATLLVLRGSVCLVFNWFWLFVSLPWPVPELLVSLTWNNIVAGMMSLHILVGLQEQSLALVFFRLHLNAGTRNRSDPQRLVVLRSGPPITCNTVSHRNAKTFQRQSRPGSLSLLNIQSVQSKESKRLPKFYLIYEKRKQSNLSWPYLNYERPTPFSFLNPRVNKIYLKTGFSFSICYWSNTFLIRNGCNYFLN